MALVHLLDAGFVLGVGSRDGVPQGVRDEQSLGRALTVERDEEFAVAALDQTQVAHDLEFAIVQAEVLANVMDAGSVEGKHDLGGGIHQHDPATWGIQILRILNDRHGECAQAAVRLERALQNGGGLGIAHQRPDFVGDQPLGYPAQGRIIDDFVDEIEDTERGQRGAGLSQDVAQVEEYEAVGGPDAALAIEQPAERPAPIRMQVLAQLPAQLAGLAFEFEADMFERGLADGAIAGCVPVLLGSGKAGGLQQDFGFAAQGAGGVGAQHQAKCRKPSGLVFATGSAGKRIQADVGIEGDVDVPSQQKGKLAVVRLDRNEKQAYVGHAPQMKQVVMDEKAFS